MAVRPSAQAIDHAQARLAAVSLQLPEARWIPTDRWHLTLAFLGNTAADLVPRLINRLDEVGRTRAPVTDLRLAGAGTFRGVLWLGVWPADRHSPADRLARHVQREMRAAGVALERRPWHAHMTVARWRHSPDRSRSAKHLSRALADYEGPRFDVAQLLLVSSRTGPNPAYTVVHSAALHRMHT